MSQLPVGNRVVVIGGGMTAIDIAVQSKRLGAGFVDIVYRRGAEQMGASRHEQELAQTSGVTIRHWSQPVEILANGHVTGVRFERTRLGKTAGSKVRGDTWDIDADVVFKAVGQALTPERWATQKRAGTRPRQTANRRTRPHLRSGRLGGRRLRLRPRRPDGLRRAGRQDCRHRYRSRAAQRRIGQGLWRTSAQLHWHFVAQPVLARVGAANRQGVQRQPRVRSRLGWRGLENAGRGPAHRQRERAALRRPAQQRSARDWLQQHRTDHGPAAGDQPR